jgi:hypothetical protein
MANLEKGQMDKQRSTKNYILYIENERLSNMNLN